MTVLIHFVCLCPLGLAIKMNFNVSKMAYSDNASKNLENRTLTWITDGAPAKSVVGGSNYFM